MIVEADLAPRDDGRAAAHDFQETTLGVVVVEPRVVRVDADGCIDALVLQRHGDRPLKVPGVRVARPHIQDRAHAGGARSRDHLVAVGVELLAVYVRVRVNEHKEAVSC